MAEQRVWPTRLAWVLVCILSLLLLAAAVGGFRASETFDAVSYWSLVLSIVSLLFGLIAGGASFYFYERGNDASREATRTLEEIRTSAREATERIDRHFERVLAAYIERPTVSVEQQVQDPFDGFEGRLLGALDNLGLGQDVIERLTGPIADVVDKQQATIIPVPTSDKRLFVHQPSGSLTEDDVDKMIMNSILEYLRDRGGPMKINDFSDVFGLSIRDIQKSVNHLATLGRVVLTDAGVSLPPSSGNRHGS